MHVRMLWFNTLSESIYRIRVEGRELCCAVQIKRTEKKNPLIMFHQSEIYL